MVPRYLISLAVGAAILWPSPPALGWSGDGHRIVCAIAWSELSPHARASVKATLDIETREQFADSCSWADEYRDKHPETAAWHSITVPMAATAIDVRRDCAGPNSCVVAQIDAQKKALGMGGSGADSALKFVAHLVGDLHQPLNVGHAEDRHGTEIKGRFYGRETNLHAVWDGGMIARSGETWQGMVKELEGGITPTERAIWIASSPVDWANESLAIALAQSTYYSERFNDFQFGPNYELLELPVVTDRLSRAGVRLGHILNEVLGDSQ